MTTVLRELNMKYKFFLPVVAVFGLFCESGFSRIFPDRIRIFGQSGLRKKVQSRSGQKTGRETLGITIF